MQLTLLLTNKLNLLHKLISVSQYSCSVSMGVRIQVLGHWFQCNCEGEEVRIYNMHARAFFVML